MTISIEKCTSPTELHYHHKDDEEAQPVYLELDIRTGVLRATCDTPGRVTTSDMRLGYVRQYRIPTLTGDAANVLMEKIAPIAEQLVGDWKDEWSDQGSRCYPVLGENACAAEEEIEILASSDKSDYAESSVIAEWDIEGATNGSEVKDHGIAVDTTDERLEEIEQRILADLGGLTDKPTVAVCHGLDAYLRGLREELREEAAA